MTKSNYSNPNLSWQVQNMRYKFRKYGYHPEHTFEKPDLTSWYNAVDLENIKPNSPSHRILQMSTTSFFDLANQAESTISDIARNGQLPAYAYEVMSDTEGWPFTKIKQSRQDESYAITLLSQNMLGLTDESNNKVLYPTSILTILSMATVDFTPYSPLIVGSIAASGVSINEARRFWVRKKVKEDIGLVQRVIKTHSLL